jgi:methionine aminopeptidase
MWNLRLFVVREYWARHRRVFHEIRRPALRPAGHRPELAAGMTFTVEPMVNAGRRT